ncbi:MAG: terminase small subunit [Oscillospiraceae bacterium]|nr:terminase small subunit [Oscillospiraceae bacterium]
MKKTEQHKKERTTIISQSEIKNLFALFYASGKNVKESALLAGLSEENAEREGLKLLKLRSTQKLIKRYRENSFSDEDAVKCGLSRLAFGEINDIMEVLLSDEPIGLHRLFKMNFFQISEVKKVKGGGIEVKLFDRQKAMEKLLEIIEKSKSRADADDFFDALKTSAELQGSDEE